MTPGHSLIMRLLSALLLLAPVHLTRAYSVAQVLPQMASVHTPSPSRSAIPPRIEPKAVWLLEAAAAKLRHATTLQAVTRRDTYNTGTDTVPYSIQLDSLRYRRPGSLFVRS